tara:strand:- start:363 stop:545 length:183 start_codon:yes stop_codon:yes gene_type:complete
MFGIFKKKNQKEKLLALYKKKKAEAFTLSKTDRRKSDAKEKEASEILEALDVLDKKEEKS